MEWDKFTFDWMLDTTNLMSNLIEIEAYKQSVLNLVLPPEWRDQLDRLSRIRAVHGTTALEGNPLSEAEVSHQMDIAEQDSEAEKIKPTREQQQIRNAGLAQQWVRQRFGPGSDPPSIADILHMHQMITRESDIDHNLPGRFRTFSVTVGSPELGGVHLGAPHEDVPRLMDEYVGFVISRRTQSQHPVIRALLAHFFLVTIHPFGDGNGRISRLLEAAILFQSDYNVFGFYGLSNYFYRNDTVYKKTLQKCRQKQPFDLTSFIEFGLRGFAEELKGINNFIKTKLNRVVYRAMLVRAFNKRISKRRRVINQREYNLLDFLIVQTEPIEPFSDNPSRQIKFSDLRDSRYIREAYKDVTTRTFWRELLRLSEMGFIKFVNIGHPDGAMIELNFEAIGRY